MLGEEDTRSVRPGAITTHVVLRSQRAANHFDETIANLAVDPRLQVDLFRFHSRPTWPGVEISLLDNPLRIDPGGHFAADPSVDHGQQPWAQSLEGIGENGLSGRV